MPIDSWIPVGYALPSGTQVRQALKEGTGWQIYEIETGGKALVVQKRLADRWLSAGLVEPGILQEFSFGADTFFALISEAGYVLELVSDCHSPKNKSEAIAFAEALKLTRQLDGASSLHSSIYVEKFSRLLPTYDIADHVGDDVVLGSWMAGGIPVSVNSARRFRSLTNWLGNEQAEDIIRKAGLSTKFDESPSGGVSSKSKQPFSLAGRPELEHFFLEHVLDIIQHEERYKRLGIEFPSAIVLHGPPGCGKTFAVERLVEYLEWPSYQIEASSVASPYIHETSKKVAQVFDKAIENAPSVIVIDEMEAFLTDRQITSGSGQHHVEEMAEFLRRIPEASKKKVLIVGMTNRIDMIDPAILRRGRFDHVIKVDMATEAEVQSLLTALLSSLPKAIDIEISSISKKLVERPLSDVSYVVREAARLAARNSKDKIDQESLLKALASAPSREEIDPPRKIGFAT